MNPFTIGFLFIFVFVILIGVAALIFLSFDAPPSANATRPSPATFPVVRRVNTQTLETVNREGVVQRWQRSAEEG